MTTTVPVAETLTLRLKYQKTTVFLYADPLQSITSLKEDLIHALRQTQPSGELGGRSIPTSPDQITLGKPIDRNDYKKGWKRIEIGEDEADTKGKKKASAKGGNSVKLAGLKENMAIAFRWTDEVDAEWEDLGETDEKWDVVIQTFEDIYGDDS